MIPVNILVAPDSFKGSLSAFDVIRAVQEAASRLSKSLVVRGVTVADGGEGTLDILLQTLNGQKIETQVTDPLGRKIPAYFGIIGSTAVIEMAVVSGLTRLKPEERNPLYTTTYGTGELIRQALEMTGISEIVVTIGGSATNDGGVGMAQALGIRALDAQGKDLLPWEIPQQTGQVG